MKNRTLKLLLVAFSVIAISSCDETATKNPEACIETPSNLVEIGESVIFTNCSKNAERYVWNFGDKTTSDSENPTHRFNDIGTYKVVLEAWNNDLKDVAEVNIQVVYDVNGPSACFTSSNKTPQVNELVTFTNCSVNAQSYSWNFGDGTTSTLANPTHAYASTGNYFVTLTVYKDLVPNTIENIISVIDGSLSIKPELYDGIPLAYYSVKYGTEFDSADGWIIGKGDSYDYSIVDGQYKMARGESGFTAISLNNFDFSSNFEIETEINISSYLNQYNNGLIWSLDNPVTNWKFFNLSPSGDYFIGHYYNNSYHPWVDWIDGGEASPDSNLLTVRLYNDNYYMFLNKQLVYTAEKNGNDEGIFMGFFISTSTVLRSEYFYVYQIDTSTKKSGNLQTITRETLRKPTGKPDNMIKGSAPNIK